MNSSSNNKRIAQNTIFLYFRMFLITVVSLYTVRVIIKTLGITDYGIYNAIGGVIMILSFLSQTITSACQRFFSYELGKKNYQKLKLIFSSILIIYFFIAIIILIIAETVGIWFLENKMLIPADRMDAAHWVFHFSVLTFIVSILTTPYIAIIIARENMKIYAYVSIIEVFFKLIIVFLLIFFSVDKLKLYSLLVFVVTCIISSLYYMYCKKKYTETSFKFIVDKSLFQSIFSYSFWTIFGTLAGAVNNQGSTILMNLFFGPKANAAQSVARQLGNAIQVFSGNIFTAVRPPMTKSYAEGNYQYVMQLFYMSSKFSFFLLYIILLPFMLKTDFILKVWLGEIENYMILFTRLTLIYVLLLSISSPISYIIQAANHVKKYHGYVDGFILLCLPSIYVFYKLGFPAETAFWVTIIVFFIAHFMRIWILREVIEFSFKEYLNKFVYPVLKVTLLSIMLSLSFSYFFYKEGWISFIFVSLVSITSIVGSVMLFGLTKYESNMIYKFLKKKYHLIKKDNNVS